MAIGTHEVSVLTAIGPVEFIGVGGIRIEVKPTLAAFTLIARIPSERNQLYTTVFKLDHVLL